MNINGEVKTEDGAEKERGRERESEGGLCLSSTRLLTFD